MNLKNKLNRELISEIELARKDEKYLTVKLLQYLVEVERRSLHLEMSYSSIFVFCVEHLGYSKDEAFIRMQGMRLLKAVPEVHLKLQSGALTLSSASKAQTAFKKENERRKELGKVFLTKSEKQSVLIKLEGESKRESEKVLAEVFPEASFVPERTKVLSANETLIQFKASTELIEKFNELKCLLAHKNYDGKWETLFSEVSDIALKKLRAKTGSAESQAKKLSGIKLATQTKTQINDLEIADEDHFGKARSGFFAAKFTQLNFYQNSLDPKRTQSTCLRNLSAQESPDMPARPKRKYISVHTKRAMMDKANAQCEYEDKLTGKRCRSKHALEVDHIKPRALGGNDAQENLRMLCRAHNQFLGSVIFS